MYPKARLDALTDGLFAVAMTLLVLDVRIPDGVHPSTNTELAAIITALWPKFFPYMTSFLVLGVSWLSGIKVRTDGERIDRAYAHWWLIYLLLVTCVPFSTVLVGQYMAFEMSTAIYATNLGLMAFCGYRLMQLAPNPQIDANWHDRRISLIILMGTCVLTLLVGLVYPSRALVCLLINLFAPAIARWSMARWPDGRT